MFSLNDLNTIRESATVCCKYTVLLKHQQFAQLSIPVPIFKKKSLPIVLSVTQTDHSQNSEV